MFSLFSEIEMAKATSSLFTVEVARNDMYHVVSQPLRFSLASSSVWAHHEAERLTSVARFGRCGCGAQRIDRAFLRAPEIAGGEDTESLPKGSSMGTDRRRFHRGGHKAACQLGKVQTRISTTFLQSRSTEDSLRADRHGTSALRSVGVRRKPRLRRI